MSVFPSKALDDGPVQSTHDGAVCRIVLNRPETRNPLGPETIAALEQAFGRASADPAIRVILIAAAGEAFSAGGNLGNFAERLQAQPDADGKDPLALNNRRYGHFLEGFVASPKITVVAAQGAAMGGGAGLVCAADIAIGVRSARFGFPETTIGLVPAQILPFVAARIGLQAARRLMLTGDRIDGDEAFRVGLLDHVAGDAAELAAKVDAVVSAALNAAPQATATTKQMLRELFGMRDWNEEGLRAYLDAASHAFAAQMRSEAIEGVAAARAKRRPNWSERMA